MKYKKGDRILYNRLMFGDVYQDQTSDTVVHVTFDRERSVIQSVHPEHMELVADAQHEAILAVQVNQSMEQDDTPASGLAEELVKLATELEEGAVLDMNVLRVRANMRSVASRLRTIAEGM